LVHETNEPGPSHPFTGKPERSVESGRDKPPVRVKFMTRMRDDVEALMKLTESSTPPKRRVWLKFITWLTYGFGNASGKGYGAALLLWDGVIFYRQGLWRWTITKERSSNYRELQNLVDSLEERAAEKGLASGRNGSLDVHGQHSSGGGILSWIIKIKRATQAGSSTLGVGNEVGSPNLGGARVRILIDYDGH